MSSASASDVKEPDVAAGEVVFSSDGLDPLPFVRPPRVVPSQLAASANLGDSIFESDEHSGRDLYQVLQKLSPDPPEQSTSERLLKVQRELASLELDVAADAAVQSQVVQLQQRLLQQHQILQGMDYLETGMDLPPASPRSNIEDLLARLERAVGSLSDSTMPRIGLVERVKTLEDSMSMVSDSKLESVGAKVKVIRQDLEAAAKAKNKLQGGDPKVIGELYDLLQQVTPMQTLLPVLAERLETLSSQHVQMASCSTRLQALESAMKLLETTLSSVEASVEKLESNFSSTIAPQLEANLQALDDRLQKLTK